MRYHAPIVLSLLALAAVPPSAQEAAQETVPLATGKYITPAGSQTEVGSFPANMLLTPDGRHVVVANTGFRQYLSVLSAETGKLVSRIEVGGARSRDKEGLYYGLAFGGSGGAIESVVRPENVLHDLYVSRGAEDKVAVYTVSGDGKLTDTGRRLDNPGANKVQNIVAGVAAGRGAKRIYAVNNNTTTETGLKGSLSVIDAADNRVLRKVDVGGFPFGVAAITAGPSADRKVYVSSERDGIVSVVDPDAGRVTKTIRTGANALALLLDRDQKRLFVANANSDTVSIVDTARDRVTQTILLRPDDLRGLPGATPTGLALSPDERTLYVTLADMNAVAVVDPRAGRLTGYIPAGWYPTACAVSADGRRLFVANAKGVARRNPNAKPIPGRGQYIDNIIEGTVSTIPIPDSAALTKYTAQVLANNRIAEAVQREQAGFHNPGIEHVLYIIKENRTYDQVLGDLPQGNGDLSQVLFGRKVTPNQHALAERFVLMDNFYVCAEVSADGWNWSTSGMENEYVARNAPYSYSGRGRRYDYEGQNNGVPADLLGLPDVARAPGGYIWDLVVKAGISFRNYGCFVNDMDPKTRLKEGPLANVKDNTPNKKALVGRTNVDFRQFDTSYPDSDIWTIYNASYPKQMKTYGRHKSPSRFAEWKREFDGYVKRGSLPRFMMIRFPNDHTNGTSPGFPTPQAMAADNDYAVGRLVEEVSKSPFWKKTAIFILEDDAQNGNDHVDAHRSTCYVISPFVTRGTIDSRFYNTDSLLRTMELLLGLPAMNQYDAVATPFRFLSGVPSNDEAYTAILPDRAIATAVNKSTAYKARESARFIATKADSVDDNLLSDIVWRSVKGRNVPMPPPRYGLRVQPKPARHDDDD
jgi:YVTN family beta-propeller protein